MDNNQAKKVFTAQELKILRQSLPKGWQDKLAQQFALSPSFVSHILRGHASNELVVLAAVELATQHQNQIKMAKEAILTL